MFNEQIFGVVLEILLLLISNLILLWSEKTYFIGFQSFGFEISFVMRHIMVNILCVLGKNVYPSGRFQLLVDSIIRVFYILTYFLSTCSISYWKRIAKISNYSCGFSNVSFCLILFCSSVFRCIHILGLLCSLSKFTLLS